MTGEGLWEVVKAVWFSGALSGFVQMFLAALLAAVLVHLLEQRRFIQGRWWDRKNQAYGDIISGLVGLVRWFEWQMKHEERLWREPEYKPSEEVLKVIRDEYKEARDRIEYAAILGDYVVTWTLAILAHFDKRVWLFRGSIIGVSRCVCSTNLPLLPVFG